MYKRAARHLDLQALACQHSGYLSTERAVQGGYRRINYRDPKAANVMGGDAEMHHVVVKEREGGTGLARNMSMAWKAMSRAQMLVIRFA